MSYPKIRDDSCLFLASPDMSASKIVLLLITALCFLTLEMEAQYHNFNHNGLTRQYIYFAPSNLSEKAPLVFVMHGYSGDAYSIQDYCQMNAIAEQNGFAVCYPRGTKDAWGNRFWNVGYEFHTGSEVNDVAFITELAVFLQSTHNLSPENTFASGMSNGGDMSFFLACEVPAIFRAVAPICGTVMTINFENCTTPIPLFAINGNDDDVTWYNGDPDNEGGWGAYLGIPEIIEHFAGLNECQSFSNETLPNINSTDGSMVEFDRHHNGINNNEVWLYRVEGGAHDWPGAWGNMDVNASEEVWHFFSQFLLTTPVDDLSLEGQSLPLVFPNPATGMGINISFNFRKQTQVRIMDISGKAVFQQTLEPVNNPTLSFNQKLETGFYTIVFTDGNGTGTVKFVVK